MVKAYVQDLAGMGRPVRLSTLIIRAWARVLMTFSPRCPYRVGDAVVGDDPFNGRREGVVVSATGASLGVETASGVFYYDHRQLKRQD
jgi:hypothetical protein